MSTETANPGALNALFPSVSLDQLEMAGSPFNLGSSFARYANKTELSKITRNERVQKALLFNDDHMINRDSFATRSTAWQRRVLRGSVLSTDATSPPYRAVYPAELSDWSFSWGEPVTGVTNVQSTELLRDLAGERLKASEGFSESWSKRHNNKSERAKLVAARCWYASQTHWLSWLQEAMAHLAAREVGNYVTSPPRIDHEVTSKKDKDGKVKVTLRPVSLMDVLKRDLGRVSTSASSSPPDEDWEGDSIPPMEVKWVGSFGRRKSIFSRKDMDFEKQKFPKSVTPAFSLSPRQGDMMRVYLADELGDFSSAFDNGLVQGEVFVSRATTALQLFDDIFAAIVHNLRLRVCSSDPSVMGRGFNSLVCVGLDRSTISSVHAAWGSLGSAPSLHEGSWLYFLVHGVGFSFAKAARGTTITMTSRDLHAMYRHLAYTRCVGCLPHGNSADAVGHSGGESVLVKSHWSVRLAAAVGLLTEASAPFGKPETRLPGVGPLDRGLRYMGVRLASNFDYITGSVYGLPRNLPSLGDLAPIMLDASIAAFADAYSLVDGVYVGWSYRHRVDLTELEEPDHLPSEFEIGTRKCWGLLGCAVGALPEFSTLTSVVPSLPEINKWGGYDVGSLNSDTAPVVLICAFETDVTPRISMRNIYGLQASPEVKLWGKSTHMSAGGWSSFTVPLYLWNFLEGSLIGDLEVPKRWGPSLGWFVDRETELPSVNRMAIRDFM